MKAGRATWALLALVAGCRAMPMDAAQHPPGQAAVPAAVLANCARNSLYSVLVMKSPDGRTGAYVLRPRIMDAPIPYLGPDGREITTFSIFDEDAARQAAGARVERLRAAYPIEEPLRCPDPPAR